MSSPPKQPPTIHEADLAPGPAGLVEFGAVLSEPEAVDRRRQGLDVVVCGPDRVKNRQLAESVEGAVGVYVLHAPHWPRGLPHVQQATQPPFGHCFYETDKRKAKKK